MKKIYTLLGLLIAFFCCGLTANAYYVNVTVDNTSHVHVYFNDEEQTLTGATTSLNLGFGAGTLKVVPATGYKCHVELNGTTTTHTVDNPWTHANGSFSITVTTEEASEEDNDLTSALLYIDVYGAGNYNEDVIASLKKGETEVTLSDYEYTGRFKTIEFNGKTEKEFTLITKDGYFFKVATIDREVDGNWISIDIEGEYLEDSNAYKYTFEVVTDDQIKFAEPASDNLANANFTFNYGSLSATEVIASFGFGADANATPEAIEESNYTAGEHTISFKASSQNHFTLVTKDNYHFNKATINGSVISGTSNGTGYVYSFDVADNDNVVFEDPIQVKSVKAKFNFKYDGYAYTDVVTQFKNGEGQLSDVKLEDANAGEKEIEFLYPLHKTFTLMTKNSHKFDVATVNGETIIPALNNPYTGYNTYTFDVTEDAEVVFEITKVVVKHKILFSFENEGTESAVKSVKLDNADVPFANEIEFEEGQAIQITVNNSNIVIDKFEVNGDAVYLYSGDSTWGSYPVQRPTSDVNVYIDAHLPSQINFTVKVNNPEHVQLNNAQYSYQCNDSNKFEVVEGDNEYQVSELNAFVFVKPNLPTNYVLDVTDEKGTSYTIASYGTKVPVHEGMILTINSYDPTALPDFTVYTYFANSDKLGKFQDKNNTSFLDQMTDGYGEMTISPTSNPFYFENGAVYVNDTKITADFMGRVFDVVLHENDFLMVLGGGNEPTKHTVMIEQNPEAEIVVLKHHKFEADNLDAIEMHEGTELLIKPATAGQKIYVATLSDSQPASARGFRAAAENPAITHNEDGSVTVQVNESTAHLYATHNQEDIETGINEISAEDAANATIFNLQGIQVKGDRLPAGLYIMNGKKVLVK